MNELTKVADETSEFDSTDIENNKVMAILAYLGILVLIPIFTARQSKFAMFHANQGLALCIAGVALSIIMSILRFIPVVGLIVALLCGLLSLVIFVFMIMGIINAANGKAKTLPIVGGIKILK